MSVSIFEIWFSIFLALFVVQWMPLPWTIGVVPSLLPFIESLAVLLPLFGILTLVLMKPLNAQAESDVIVAVLLSVVLTIAIAGLVAIITRVHDLAPNLAIAAAIVGIGMIWFSYRSWLQADLE